MIKLLHIFLILFINVPFCTSMDFARTPAKILHEITAVKKPISVFCPSNTEIIITGKDADIIHNVNFQNTYTVLNKYDKDMISFSSLNQSNTQFALLRDDIINIYTIPSYSVVHTMKDDYLSNKPVFGISNNTIFMLDKTGNIKQEIYNTTNKCSGTYAMFQKKPTDLTHIGLAHHPHKEEIAYFAKNELIMLSYENSNLSDNYANICPPDQCKYNDNGEFLVFNSPCCHLDIYTIMSEYCNVEKITVNGIIYTFSFLPRSYILAVLYQPTDSPKKTCITFLNLKKQQSFIKTIELPYLFNNDNDEHSSWRKFSHRHEFMNFFPDRSKFTIALHNKTIIVETPFEAQHLPETQEKVLFILFALGQLNSLSEKLKYDITAKTLDLHRHSYTIY